MFESSVEYTKPIDCVHCYCLSVVIDGVSHHKCCNCGNRQRDTNQTPISSSVINS